MAKTMIGRILMAALLAGGLAAEIAAQTTWQTTKTTRPFGWSSGPCDLARAELRVKVHEAYLDVEEDIEIGTQGVVSPGDDPNTLEIVGSFSLPSGAAIVGSLLWDGDRILEGKLLDRKVADSLYEEMVDRNSIPPPRPRDPLILELTGKDTYRLRIYPVKLGNQRRFRLRYQLPPRIGAAGLEMSLRAVAGGLFPGSQATLPVTFAPGGSVTRAVLAEAAGRTTLTLPRTRFLKVADLGPTWSFWTPDGGYQTSLGLTLHPVDPRRQVMVKTAFASGSFAGHYLNLYAGVDESVIGALMPKVEIVVYWKWRSPHAWLVETPYGEQATAYLGQAQQQAWQLYDLHANLGGPGTRIGLLHDDGRNAARAFRTAAQGEDEYRAAQDYLRGWMATGIEEFARAARAKPPRGDGKGAAKASQDRFLSDLRIVKSLYSPATGTVRHLLMVSAGPEIANGPSVDSAFAAELKGSGITLGAFAEHGFDQVGFDFRKARQAHPYTGPLAATAWGDLPGLPPMTLNVVVRGARKAYDFSVPCRGGMGGDCGTLEFHGKSDEAWADSLEWEAFDAAGRPIGTAVTRPHLVQRPEDTAIALLWAGSEMPFSDKRAQPPLGPTYGFVDRWASLLALEKDSLDRERLRAFADSGVPRIANKDLKDVLPNYGTGDGPGGTDGPTSVAAALSTLGDPATWRLERTSQGRLVLRIPGLRAGTRVRAAAYDLHGRRLASWDLRAGDGALEWDASALGRGGVCLLKLVVGGFAATKRIAP